MKIFYGFGQLPPFNGAVATIGSYDGLHYGHRKIIEILNEQADAIGGQSVVITFSPHPRQVLGKDGVKLLNSLEEKIFLLEQVHVDNLVVIPFDTEFSRVSSQEFIADYLVGKIGMKVAVVGYNHRFGHDKECAADILTRMSEEYGFGVVLVDKCDLGERKVSSTQVRKAVEQGDMGLANEYLCRPYFILGDIRNGCLSWREKDKLIPAAGTYDVLVNHIAANAVIDEDGRVCLKNVCGGAFGGNGSEEIRNAMVEFV